MHISELRLKNFKRFGEVTISLDRAITLLLGPNSSGKSSAIKAILALKQTASPTNENESLATQGEYVDLGVYKDYVHGHDTSKNIEISTTFTSASDGFLMPEGSNGKINLRLEYSHDHITQQARLQELTVCDGGSGDQILHITKKKTRDTYYLELPREAIAKHFPILNRGPKGSEDPLREASHKVSVRIDDRFSIVPDIHGNDSLSGSKRELSTYGLPAYIAKFIIDEFFRGLDKEFFYLGPLRKSPSRSYARTGHLLSVGAAGEHTPSVLANLKARASKERSSRPVQRQRLEQLNSWIDLLFPGKIVSTESIDELIKLKVYNGSGDVDAISDVGFGVSQILPILVQIAVMPDGSTLIIEQPELHLHPSVQTRLAEIVAIASLSGRRFLIETHSEHFVRGLQLAVAAAPDTDGHQGISTSDVSFIYVPDAPHPPLLLELNEWGEFEQEWPPGFFDEAYRLAMKLLQKKMQALSKSSNSNNDGEISEIRRPR
ncbi:AAA family ATPase [Roseateles sp. BYS87W]|uniref:AAA family ATPase n=1 Tax=Pelomonas baiyunensis TaxID=3299026 RepID=A0ABW7H017_9BURK